MGRSDPRAGQARSPPRDQAIARIVLDTSVLIDHLRGRKPEATELLENAVSRRDELWSSYVVLAELLAGMRPAEEAPTRGLIGAINWAPVDAAAAEEAGDLGRRHLRKHPGIGIADLLLAALAQRLGAEIKTTNVKHFPMFEGLKPPY